MVRVDREGICDIMDGDCELFGGKGGGFISECKVDKECKICCGFEIRWVCMCWNWG